MSVVSANPNLLDEPVPPVERFTREQYRWLVDNDLLDHDRRYELIEGVIVEKMSQKEPHAAIIMRWIFALADVFGRAFIRNQASVVISNYSEPEPDIMVTSHESNVYVKSGKTPLASDIRLATEVSVTTLSYDAKVKAKLYAQSGIGDYWILDVSNRRLIVHREPTPEGYASVATYAEGDLISPLAAPEASFAVADFLP